LIVNSKKESTITSNIHTILIGWINLIQEKYLEVLKLLREGSVDGAALSSSLGVGRMKMAGRLANLVKWGYVTETKEHTYAITEHGLEVLMSSLTPNHNEIRDLIGEIGKLEGKICEVEYPIDSYRLDVAWKRIKAGNPSHAFEVHLHGDFFEALTKLKHAWDKWNSKPFLITTEEYAEKARLLLEGSFHEIQEVTRIIGWNKILQLHRLEKDLARMKTELGF